MKYSKNILRLFLAIGLYFVILKFIVPYIHKLEAEREKEKMLMVKIRAEVKGYTLTLKNIKKWEFVNSNGDKYNRTLSKWDGISEKCDIGDSLLKERGVMDITVKKKDGELIVIDWREDWY